MKSLIQKDNNHCFLCGSSYGLETHEAFFGSANRKKAIADHMQVRLCFMHHKGTSQGVHLNRENDLIVKRAAQEAWEKTYGDREQFIKRYGKNWL